MHSDIEHLFRLQKLYLFKVLENVPDELTYEKQLEGVNSVGWIMGHLCAEGVDALRKMALPYEGEKDWMAGFSHWAPKIESIDGLPDLTEIKKEFEQIYALLLLSYKEISPSEREKRPKSELLGNFLPNVSSWLAHHLTTHLSVHIGGIIAWKKIVGLKVNGF